MTTEDDFQSALDANPDDWQTRLVFADWLEERGDRRAEGMRALGMLRLWPYRWRYSPDPAGVYRWLFHNGKGTDSGKSIPRCHVLPQDWLNKSAKRKLTDYMVLIIDWDIGVELASRLEMENVVVLAFAKLPAKRRRELLAGKNTGGGKKKPASRRRT